MLIKLTSTFEKYNPIVINPDEILSLSTHPQGYTLLTMTSKSGGCGENDAYNIKESPDEILAMLKEPDAEIASLKARIKELDDALTDSQAHLAWAEQDSRALSELRQAARELITELQALDTLTTFPLTSEIYDKWEKLEALLEKP